MKYKIKIFDEEKKVIEIGEDEIFEVNYKIKIIENNSYANGRSSTEIEITGKQLSGLDTSSSEEKNTNEELYEKNKKNIIELINWAESYMEKNDYRDIEIFVNLGGNRNIQFKFINMFVDNFTQEFSIEKGIGIFKLKLRQKFHQKNKIEVN